MAVDITDTQRREVVEKLRAEAESWRCCREDDSAFCMSDSDFTEAVLEDFVLDDMDTPDYEVFNRMADIVDRPTCEMVVKYGHACCGRCGHVLAGEREVEEGYYEFRPFCPDCGARVVRDDD